MPGAGRAPSTPCSSAAHRNFVALPIRVPVAHRSAAEPAGHFPQVMLPRRSGARHCFSSRDIFGRSVPY